jgi:hypothetical protein
MSLDLGRARRVSARRDPDKQSYHFARVRAIARVVQSTVVDVRASLARRYPGDLFVFGGRPKLRPRQRSAARTVARPSGLPDVAASGLRG